MRIQLIRNATLIIHHGSERILVDPMLGAKGSLPPFSVFRQKARRNPTVELPAGVEADLASTTSALITHCRYGHSDHLDRSGIRLLVDRNIPVYCNRLDENHLRRKGIRKTVPLVAGVDHEFLGGTIRPIPTAHGYGLMGRLMGPGLGYFIQLPSEPSLYLSGDTVLTPAVRNVLAELKPAVSILAAGSAQMDLGRPILMPMSEILEFSRLAPGIVVANHLEALNHCPVTREELRAAVDREGLSAKTLIPLDGEILEF